MNCRIRKAKHETREALAHFRAMTDKRSWCSVDGKGAISSVRLCSPANTKLRRLKVPPQSRPTVDRVKRISSRLVIKFTFFVVLDTCQSIKRKLSWGRYWG